MAQIKQSRPDSGLGFQVKVITTFPVVPFSGRDNLNALFREVDGGPRGFLVVEGWVGPRNAFKECVFHPARGFEFRVSSEP